MLVHKPVALALIFALGAAVHTGCSSRDGSANGQTEHAKVPELTVDEVETVEELVDAVDTLLGSTLDI